MPSSHSLISIFNEHSRSYFKIGVNIRTPSDYSGTESTIVDSGRNTDGQVVCEIIREDVAKIEAKWKFLTIQEYASLCQQFNSKFNGSFFVACCFFNETKGDFEGDDSRAPSSASSTGTNKLRMFYPGDRKAVVAKLKLDENGKPIGYENVSLSLIDTGLLYGETL